MDLRLYFAWTTKSKDPLGPMDDFWYIKADNEENALKTATQYFKLPQINDKSVYIVEAKDFATYTCHFDALPQFIRA